MVKFLTAVPALVLLLVLAGSPLLAQEPTNELFVFDAIRAGTVDVRVIPRDAHQVTVLVRNTTTGPVRIRLPGVLAAVPVLPEPGSPASRLPQQQTQALGIGYGNPTLVRKKDDGAGSVPAVHRGGVFSVPPGKVVRKTLKSVCLQYGIPEPGPRNRYKLAPIDEVASNDQVSRLLGYLTPANQRVVQLAAWHLNNKMSWDQLALVRIPPGNGRSNQPFQRHELEAAYRMVQWLKMPTPRPGN
jgi:hypothetical protein